MIIGYVGHALGLQFDEIRPNHEFAVTENGLDLPVGRVEPSGVVNFRWRFRGIKEGKPVLTTQMLWIADRSIPGWDKPDGWEVEVAGAPGVRLRVDLIEPVGLPDRSKAMQYCVAGPVMNAIQEVIDAEPGVLVVPHFAAYKRWPVS